MLWIGCNQANHQSIFVDEIFSGLIQLTESIFYKHTSVFGEIVDRGSCWIDGDLLGCWIDRALFDMRICPVKLPIAMEPEIRFILPSVQSLLVYII